MKDSFSTGISQSQTASSDLSCLSNNRFTQLFDADFKSKLQTNLSNAISGVGVMANTSTDISEKIANKLYTENSIKSIQTAINRVDQAQTQNVIMDDSATGKISQDQASSIITKHVSDIASDSIT